MFRSRSDSRTKKTRHRAWRRRALRKIEVLENRRVLATYFVDTTADIDTGVCAADNPAGNVDCSIRSAILAAEANPGPDTIQIPDGTYVNDFAGSFDTFEAQDLAFVGNVANPSAVVIDGINQFRLFDLLGFGASHTISFQGMTLRNGVARDGSGGAAINAGQDVDLQVDNVIIENNLADSYLLPFPPFSSSPSSGGGIQASGNVTITNSVIRNNAATEDGGGLEFAPFAAPKTLTIRNTTISGNQAGTGSTNFAYGGGVRVKGPDATVVFDNVTFDGNVAGDSGGGAYVSDAALMVSSSSFTNNQALGNESGGGGLYVLGQGPSGPAFSVNGGSFTGNTAVQGAGGFEAVNNSGTIDGASFILNRVTGVGTSFDEGGGAIAVLSTVMGSNAQVTLRNLFVSENTAPSAGGIASVDTRLTIEDSTISGNEATGPLLGSAGGIGAVANEPGVGVSIFNSSILNNTAVLQAGGIGAIDANLSLADSVVDGNVASTGRAGGIGLTTVGTGIEPVLQTNAVTISNNEASGDGGGIGVDGVDFFLLNTTISGNRSLAGNGGGIALVNANPSIGPEIQFSTIASNQAVAGSNLALQNSDLRLQATLIADGTGVGIGSSFVSLGGNLDQNGTLGLSGPGDLSGVDPLLGPLQDNGGPVPTHALLPGSPAIDTGPASVVTEDARGVTRPQDGDGVGGAAFDIGAFEAEAAIASLVVDTTDDIDDGIYTPGNLSLREAVNLVNTGVALTSTISFDDTVFNVPQTITLSGSQIDVTSSMEIMGPGQNLLTISANLESRIFQITGASNDVSISAMTLAFGYASGVPGTADGGAIKTQSANLTLADVTIANSQAEEAGGALSFDGGNIQINNSLITGNSSQQNAGGIENVGVLTISDSTIENNSAIGPYAGFGYGGGIRNSATLTLIRSRVSGNTASEDGGGIETTRQLTLIDSEVSGNTAGSFGGGMSVFNLSEPVSLIRSTVSGNTAGNSGGGIFNSGGTISIRDSLVSGNRTDENGGGIFNYNGGVVQLTNSTVSGNEANLDGGGIANAIGYGASNSLMVVSNSTITLNRSDADGDSTGTGGGIWTFDGAETTTRLFNSIVAGNVRGAAGSETNNDLDNKAVDSGSAFNLIGDPLTSGGLVDGINGNIVGDAGTLIPLATILDPLLADNGGATFTHALVPGSLAIDAASTALATTPGDDGIPGTSDANESTLAEDQRGLGFPRVNGVSVDIGAYEAPAVVPPPRVTIADVLVNEADGTATVIVTLEDAASDAFTLSWSTIDGTADGVDDFLADSGTLDFLGVAFEQNSFVVSIDDDAIAEARESFFIELSVVSASEPLDLSDVGVVTIEDDDEAVLSIASVAVDENAGVMDVTVQLQGQTDDAFTVELSTGDYLDGASGGIDYVSKLEVLTFSGFDGETHSFTVTINDDDVVEGDELFAIVADGLVTNGSNVHFAGFGGRVELFSAGQFTPASAFSLAVDWNATGDIAYLADGTGLYVIDVSDPFNPVELGSYVSPFSSSYDIKVVGNVAYLLSGALEVLDISDPANIAQLGSYSHPSLFMSSLDVEGTNVYLGLSDSFSFAGGLAVVDAVDPGNLSLLGQVSSSQVNDVVVRGGVAYLATTVDGLAIYDVSDPANLSALGFSDSVEAFSVAVEGSLAYVGAFDGLYVFDVSDPSRPATLGSYPTISEVFSVDVDVSNPTAPLIYLTSIEFAAVNVGRVTILDGTDPANLQRLGDFAGLSEPYRVLANGGDVLVADGPQGLQVLLAETASLSDATILNDDTATLTVSDVTVDEAAGTVSVTVTLDLEVDGGFSYDYTTADGTAIAGSDYTTTTGSFTTGAAGEQQTIVIPILADGIPEADETFSVSLSNVTPFGSVSPLSVVSVSAFASVSPDAIDASDVGTVTITEPTGVDLSITKADSLDPVRPGDDLIYTLVVTNNGTADATGVVVVDVLPAGLTFEIGAIDGDISRVTNNAGTVTADVGNLAIGQSATIVINVIVESNAVHPLSNTASVSANESDANAGDNSATEQTSVDNFSAVDDLFFVSEDSVSNSLDVLTNDLVGLNGPITVIGVAVPSRGAVSIGTGGSSLTYTPSLDEFGQDLFEYTIQDAIGNTSTATVTINITPVNDPPTAVGDTVSAADRGSFSIPISGLLINDSAGPANEMQSPSLVSFDAVTAGGGDVQLSGGDLVYTPAPGFLGNSDSFSYTITDGQLNDTATVTINLPPLPDIDLATSITDSLDPVGANETVTLTISIENLGTAQAANVLATTAIPAEFTIVSADVSPFGSVSVLGNTVSTSFLSLDGGDLATLTIIVAAGDVGGTFVTTTDVASSDIDLDPANNSASESTTILVPASIFGHVYCDLDGSGGENSGEQSVGTRVFLDLDGDRIFDQGERETFTDSAGDYRFDNVLETAVTVVAEVPMGCNTVPFAPGVVRSTIGVGDLARSIADVDLDNDGDLDLLVASDGSNSLSVLINDGGNFTLDREIPLSDRPQSVAAWNPGDGSSPLIAVAGVGTPSDGGTVFLFHLDGPSTTLSVGNGPIDVAFDDFNLNGLPDLLVGTLRTSDVQLIRDIQLTPGVTLVPELVATGRLIRSIASGDVNNDGLPDIIAGAHGHNGDLASELIVLLQNPNPDPTPLPVNGFNPPAATLSATIAQKLVATQVADLTGNPQNESDTRILALSAGGEFKVFAVDATGLVEVAVLQVAAGANSFDVGDFNRDGFTDVAISNQGQQQIDLFVGDGTGQFLPILTLNNVAAPSDLTIGDFDNDEQVDDLAVTNFYQDANIGQFGSPKFFLPSATTILRTDVAEAPVVVGGMATQVDFAFQSADPEIRLDVSGDGMISALDALRVINAMARQEAEGEFASGSQRADTDVNGDGRTSAIDALMVINFLQGIPGGQVSVEDLSLLAGVDDDPDRVAAVDVLFSNLLF